MTLHDPIWNTIWKAGYDEGLQTGALHGAAVICGITGMFEAIRDRHNERAVAERMAALLGPRWETEWPNCGCHDGTDPDEPADRGFICPHDPAGAP